MQSWPRLDLCLPLDRSYKCSLALWERGFVDRCFVILSIDTLWLGRFSPKMISLLKTTDLPAGGLHNPVFGLKATYVVLWWLANLTCITKTKAKCLLKNVEVFVALYLIWYLYNFLYYIKFLLYLLTFMLDFLCKTQTVIFWRNIFFEKWKRTWDVKLQYNKKVL